MISKIKKHFHTTPSAVWAVVSFLLFFLPLAGGTFIAFYSNYRITYKADTQLIQANEVNNLGLQASLIAEDTLSLKEDIEYLSNVWVLLNIDRPDLKDEDILRLTNIFLSFIRRKPQYHQVRWLTPDGRELIKLQTTDAGPAAVEAENLQDKSRRYYFSGLHRLQPDEIYISPFDLNVELDQIETPPVPTIRIGKKILNKQGELEGFIMLNYAGANIFNIIKKTSIPAAGTIMLINSSGYLLYGKNPEDQWGFMFPDRELETLSYRSPALWNQIAGTESGVSEKKENYYAFKRIAPFTGIKGIYSDIEETKVKYGSLDKYHWYLLSEIPAVVIAERFESIRSRYILICFIIFPLLAFAAAVYAYSRIKNRKAENRFRIEAEFFIKNPAPVFKTSKGGELLQYNPASADLFNEITLGTPVERLFKGGIDQDMSAGPQNNKSLQFEKEINGKNFLFTVKKHPTENTFLFYGSDISRTKQVEEELRKLSVAVEQSANAVIITDSQGIMLYVNRAFEEISGYRREEVLSKAPDILASGQTPQNIYESLWNTIRSGRVWRGQILNKKKNGQVYWEETVITPVTDENGNIVNYIAVKEDISKRKMHEKELHEAKEQAELANKLKSEFLANMSHEIRTPMNAIIGFSDILKDEEEDPEKKEKLDIIVKSGNHLLNIINNILDFSKIEKGKIELQMNVFSPRALLDQISKNFTNRIWTKDIGFHLEFGNELPASLRGDDSRISQIVLNILSNAYKFTEKGDITLRCGYRDKSLTIEISDTGIGITEDKLDNIFTAFEQADSSMERLYGGTGLGLAISKKLTDIMGGELLVKSKLGKGSTFTIKLPIIPGRADASAGPDQKPSPAVDESETQKQHGADLIKRWREQTKDDPFLAALTEKVINDMPSFLDKLNDAIIKKNATDIRFLSHELSILSGNLEIEEIFEQTFSIEKTAEAEPVDFDEISRLFNQLRAIIKQLPADELKKGIPSDKISFPNPEQLKILIAEDNETNLLLIENQVVKLGLQSDASRNGSEALKMLKNGRYNILLLDMQMPILNGPDLVSKIRSDTQLRNTYVIALTAHALKGDADKYIRAGCDDYLSKPLSLRQLAEKLIKISLIIYKKELLKSVPSQKLSSLVDILKKNLDLFNPERLKKAARDLKKMTDFPGNAALARRIQKAADTFDEVLLERIIEDLQGWKHGAE